MGNKKREPTPEEAEARSKALDIKKWKAATAKARVDKRIERRTYEALAVYHTPEGKIINVAEAARQLGVTERRVRSFIEQGRLPAIKIVKLYLIKWTDLMEFDATPRMSGKPKQNLFEV